MLTVLLRIFSTGLRSISVSDDYARAILVAEAQLESANVSSSVASNSVSGVAGQKYHWTRTVEDYLPYPASESITVPLNAYTVTVNVEWPYNDGLREVSLSTIKLADSPRGNR